MQGPFQPHNPCSLALPGSAVTNLGPAIDCVRRCKPSCFYLNQVAAPSHRSPRRRLNAINIINIIISNTIIDTIINACVCQFWPFWVRAPAPMCFENAEMYALLRFVAVFETDSTKMSVFNKIFKGDLEQKNETIWLFGRSRFYFTEGCHRVQKVN